MHAMIAIIKSITHMAVNSDSNYKKCNDNGIIIDTMLIIQIKKA